MCGKPSPFTRSASSAASFLPVSVSWHAAEIASQSRTVSGSVADAAAVMGARIVLVRKPERALRRTPTLALAGRAKEAATDSMGGSALIEWIAHIWSHVASFFREKEKQRLLRRRRVYVCRDVNIPTLTIVARFGGSPEFSDEPSKNLRSILHVGQRAVLIVRVVH